MKITPTVFSIPPYISTSWSQVNALIMQSQTLIVSLKNGPTVEIPGLHAAVLENIFNTHAAYIEQTMQPNLLNPLSHPIAQTREQRIELPLQVASMEELGSALQHNPAQKNAPNIPREILHKIVAITKIVSPTDMQLLPKPEPHCNCVHCQIAKAMTQASDESEPHTIMIEKDEEVADSDLHFQQWQIEHLGNQMYTVTNKLDAAEKYSVFLGNPVGCTCGISGCEHIVAVLKS